MCHEECGFVWVLGNAVCSYFMTVRRRGSDSQCLWKGKSMTKVCNLFHALEAQLLHTGKNTRKINISKQRTKGINNF